MNNAGILIVQKQGTEKLKAYDISLAWHTMNDLPFINGFYGAVSPPRQQFIVLS
jgi:hypothetical protein